MIGGEYIDVGKEEAQSFEVGGGTRWRDRLVDDELARYDNPVIYVLGENIWTAAEVQALGVLCDTLWHKREHSRWARVDITEAV